MNRWVHFARNALGKLTEHGQVGSLDPSLRLFVSPLNGCIHGQRQPICGQGQLRDGR